MQQCTFLLKKFFLLSILTLATTACYRMPTDEDYCVIPTTNNPDVTREKGGNMPSMNY